MRNELRAHVRGLIKIQQGLRRDGITPFLKRIHIIPPLLRRGLKIKVPHGNTDYLVLTKDDEILFSPCHRFTASGTTDQLSVTRCRVTISDDHHDPHDLRGLHDDLRDAPHGLDTHHPLATKYTPTASRLSEAELSA